MNVSYRWLKALAPTLEGGVEAVAERLTYRAVPVDEVIPLARGLDGIVVGRVAEIAPHPNADRLVLCAVDIGRNGTIQVVTGAPNVVEGAYYPFVGVGGSLPGGQEIEKVKLRGEYSEGMLCSERELGLGRDQAGIMQLRGDYEPGQPLVEALGLDDYRLVLDVTPNRPDLLGQWGVARELAPGGEADLRTPEVPDAPDVTYEVEQGASEVAGAGVTIRIEDPDGCGRYMGLVLRGVEIGPSPEWLANRLRSIGVQPINNVVDATNYVLYELNQPLHAFDLDRLEGPTIVVRRAREGERIRTLDDRDRELDSGMLVIADADRPCAVAGVMGGADSEVGEDTRDILLECAYFDPVIVRRTANGLGLATDASYRFERGIDPAGQPRALRRVAEIILATAGGSPESHAVDVHPRPATEREAELRPSRIGRILGVELEPETLRACLDPIGFRVTDTDGDALRVAIPTWRPDVEREIDLIEEVARRYGYDRFPDEMNPHRPTEIPEDSYVRIFDAIRDHLTGIGFLEAKTVPFTGPEHGELRLSNPLAEPEAHLRSNLLPGLLRRVEHNFARGQRDVRIFELATAFSAVDAPRPDEHVRVAAAWTGLRHPPHWSDDGGDWDVWDLKWILEITAGLASPGTSVRPTDAEIDAGGLTLHDGLAVVSQEGDRLGWGGRIDERAVDAPPWAGAVWGIEVEVLGIGAAPVAYREVPTYPAVDRDIALITPRSVPAERIEDVIRSSAPEFLESAAVFDVYEGGGIPDGHRSVAWRLRFRSPERTLTDDEVDDAMAAITSALETQLDVGIRGS